MLQQGCERVVGQEVLAGVIAPDIAILAVAEVQIAYHQHDIGTASERRNVGLEALWLHPYVGASHWWPSASSRRFIRCAASRLPIVKYPSLASSATARAESTFPVAR
jgi:hypothetical protein